MIKIKTMLPSQKIKIAAESKVATKAFSIYKDQDFPILLSIYDVSNDFVISKKKIIDFRDELGLFIKEIPVFTKQKFRCSAVSRLPSAVC
jgi:hypothetical protein